MSDCVFEHKSFRARPGPDSELGHANAERERLKSAWPNEWRDGARAGLLQQFPGERERGGYPLGFFRWPPSRRDCWLAGYSYGRMRR